MRRVKFVAITVLVACVCLAAASTAAASTTVTVTSSANPVIAGQTVTFTVTLSPAPSSNTTVDFWVDPNTESPDQVSTRIPIAANTGTGTYTMAFSGLGTHSVEAYYYVPSGGSPPETIIETVNAPPTDGTVTRLSASPNPAVADANITVSATVTDTSDASRVPTGDVTFESDGAPVGDAPLDPAGHASTQISGLTPGIHSLTAVYAGEPAGATTVGWVSSVSSAFAEVITAAPDPTSITLSSSNDPIAAGRPVILVAHVTDTSAAGTVPKGSVSFIDNGRAIATAGLSALGYARTQVRLRGGIDHLLAAVFIPRGPWLGSTSDQFDELVVGSNRVSAPRACRGPSKTVPVHIDHGSHVSWVAYLIDGVLRAISRRSPTFSVRLPVAHLRHGQHRLTAVLHYVSKARNHPTQKLNGSFHVC